MGYGQVTTIPGRLQEDNPNRRLLQRNQIALNRISRWALALRPYCFLIVNKKGRSNHIPELLAQPEVEVAALKNVQEPENVETKALKDTWYDY